MWRPVDWRTRYVTKGQFREVKQPEFLIDRFLEDGAILALAGPVAQRKSIVAANVIAALLTGELLFGYFKVVKRPERTIYHCPEMGLAEIARRLGRLGLGDYVGERLFVRSMDDATLKLTELDEELPRRLCLGYTDSVCQRGPKLIRGHGPIRSTRLRGQATRFNGHSPASFGQRRGEWRDDVGLRAAREHGISRVYDVRVGYSVAKRGRPAQAGGSKPRFSHSSLMLRSAVIRRTCTPTCVAKSSESGFRKSAMKRCRALRRAKEKGTSRCFRPLPLSTRSMLSRSTSETRKPSASLMRAPVSSNSKAKR